jgi:hypothetical protein
MLHGSGGVVGHPELGEARPCPGLPEACPPGGPLVPLVGHGSAPCQEVPRPSGSHPSRLPPGSPAGTQQRLARARL